MEVDSQVELGASKAPSSTVKGNEGGRMTALVSYVELTLRFNRDDGRWVGVCVELGTSTFGKKLEQVEADLRTLVGEHINLLEEAGERARFFSEHEILEHHVKPIPHAIRIPVPDADTNGLYFQPGIFQFSPLSVPA